MSESLTEVRYTKSTIYLLIIIVPLITILPLVFDYFKGNQAMSSSLVPIVVFDLLVIVAAYLRVKRQLSNDRRAMTFSTEGLELHENAGFIPWSAINKWRIHSDDDVTELVLYTDQGNKRQTVLGLDHTRRQIEDLLEQYRGELEL